MRALALAFALLAIPARADWGAGRQMCQIADERIAEASGIAASRVNPGVFYTHNDSGDSARFFAFDKKGRTVATLEVQGAKAVDWEDMAAAPDASGRPTVYLGDIGDNGRKRESCAVYAVQEPRLAAGKGARTLAVRARVLRFRYPDGPHNAETLMVDPRSRAVYIVTKEDGVRPSAVFRVEPRFDGTLQTAKRVGEVALSDPLPFQANLATGGDISPDGRRMVIRTYQQALEYTIPRGGSVEQALKTKPRSISLILEQQGEAICYGRDGKSLITTSEQRPTPVYLYPWTNTTRPTNP